MAWDLWSSTYDEAVRDCSNSESLERQYDTYFDCEHDIMEEDALNEKYCIQVLKNLITKEDAEIEELEKDLLSLQNELARTEHQNWPEICSNALTEKINCLEVSIRSLKNDHADNDGIQLLLRNEPARTIDEILKAALADYCQDNCRQDRLAIAVPRSADLGSIRAVISTSDEMNLGGTSDLKVLVNDEVRISQLVPTNEGEIRNSVSSKGKEYVLRVVKQEREVVKDVITDERLHSNLCPLRQVKHENSNFDQTLCVFYPKSAQRDCEKESMVASTQDCERRNAFQVDTTQSLYLAAPEPWNHTSLLHIMNIQSASLVNVQCSGLGSMLEMQTKSALFSGSQLTDKGNSQLLCLKSEPTANLRTSIVSEPDKLKNQRKRKLKSEPGENPVELISNTSSEVTHKRPRKSRASNGGASLVYSLSGKVAERTIRLEQRGTEYAMVPYDSKFSEWQKKRNACKVPVTSGIQNSLVTVDISKLNPVAVDNGNHEVEAQNNTSALVPVSLKNMTLIKLRAIAKQYNVKKYYRLAKGPLLEELAQIIGGW